MAQVLELILKNLIPVTRIDLDLFGDNLNIFAE